MNQWIHLKVLIASASKKAEEQRLLLEQEIESVKTTAREKAASPMTLLTAFVTGYALISVCRHKKTGKSNSSFNLVPLVSGLSSILSIARLLK